jgi:anti-sigma B factor antagonist
MIDELTIQAEKKVNKISETEETATLILHAKGRINTNTAPKFEEAANANLCGVDKVILDFSELQYMSSAGIRVVLMIYKKIGRDKNRLTVLNPNTDIIEVLTITGFANRVTIEKKTAE